MRATSGTETMTTRLTIRKPDDWHLHLRDGAMLKAVVAFTAKNFGRAILMPNLVPPVTTTKDAIAYRARVLAALPPASKFEPLMTCYLTDDTNADDVERGFKEGVFTGVKLYPAHATTNSAAGVTDFRKIMPVLERIDRKSTRLNSSHEWISYAVFCLKKKKKTIIPLSSQIKKKKQNKSLS